MKGKVTVADDPVGVATRWPAHVLGIDVADDDAKAEFAKITAYL